MSTIHPSRIKLVNSVNQASRSQDQPHGCASDRQEADLKARLLNRRGTQPSGVRDSESSRTTPDDVYDGRSRDYSDHASRTRLRHQQPSRHEESGVNADDAYHSLHHSPRQHRYTPPPTPLERQYGYDRAREGQPATPGHPGPPPEAPPRARWGRVDGGRSGGPAVGGSDFFADRDAQRKASARTLWPESPKRSLEEEEREEEEKAKREKGRHKGKYRSSREDRKRRRGHDGDKQDNIRKGSHRSETRHRTRHHTSRSPREGIRKSSEHRQSKRSPLSLDSTSTGTISDNNDRSPLRKLTTRASRSSEHISRSEGRDATIAKVRDGVDLEGGTEDTEVIGPSLPITADGQRVDPRAYGGALLAGEGAAMAAYVADGARIPRRGEIGLDSDQIEKYEQVGYVMSGSRHQRMNAVRMRKENQVISAEEQRSILKMRKEEKDKREREIVGQFRELVDTFAPSR